MSKNDIARRAFVNAGTTAAYIAAVAWLMYNGEMLFGNKPSFAIPFMMLLLFVFSAAATGSLVLLKPILLYLDGQKENAVRLFLTTLAFLFLFFSITVFLIIAFS